MSQRTPAWRDRSSALFANLRAERGALALALLVIVIDQLSKWWMMEIVLGAPRVIEVTPFFNLVWVWNTGVSFGMMGGGRVSPLLLVALSLCVSVLLVWWLAMRPGRLAAFALGLVLGGALGNVIDRLVYGAVFDFIDLHVAGYHWPAFNVADSAITIGVALLIWDGLFTRQPAR